MLRLPAPVLSTAPALSTALALGLCLAAPAAAQMLYQQYDPNAETVRVDGPWARYQTHVLKKSAQDYTVLFRPGFVDAQTALRAIAPLCQRQGLTTALIGPVAPVSLVQENGEDRVHQGIRVTCVKAK